jgi:hypothetical protein
MKFQWIAGCLISLMILGCGQRTVATTTSTRVETTSGESPQKSPETVADAATSAATVSPRDDVSHDESHATQTNDSSFVDAKPVEPKTSDAPGVTVVVGEGEPLDLAAYYHTPASVFEKIERYPWRDAARGPQTFGNVRLEIGGMICLWGAKNAEGGLVFPEYVEGIRVARKFEALYLYHAIFHNAPDETPVSHLVMNYENGTFFTTELRCGVHVRDWLQNPTAEESLIDTKSKLVWRGKSSMHPPESPRELRFFMTEIANPHPLDEVVTIDLVSAKERSASCILAITTGAAGLLKVGP